MSPSEMVLSAWTDPEGGGTDGPDPPEITKIKHSIEILVRIP